jgi:hypothetical protein
MLPRLKQEEEYQPPDIRAQSLALDMGCIGKSYSNTLQVYIER